MEIFSGSILVFPSYLVVLGEGAFEDFDNSPSLVVWQVYEADIDSSACPMMGPPVVPIEGVMSGNNGRGEVLSELALGRFKAEG